MPHRNLAHRHELEASATVTNKALLEEVKKAQRPGEDAPDDPYLPPGEDYRMMRLVHGNRTARRLRLVPAEGPGHSAKWAFVFDLVDDLERQSETVAQSITIATNIGSFRIEGFGLHLPGGLYDMLDEERVREVAAYSPKRHGSQRPPAPYVSAIIVIPAEFVGATEADDEDGPEETAAGRHG